MDYSSIFTALQDESEQNLEKKSLHVAEQFSQLTYLGHGVHKTVFKIENQSKVLKVPFEKTFTDQLRTESQNYEILQNSHYSDWFAPVQKTGPNYTYLIMDFVDMSVDCEQQVVANIKSVLTEVETGRDNFGLHPDLGAVTVDYTKPVKKKFKR